MNKKTFEELWNKASKETQESIKLLIISEPEKVSKIFYILIEKHLFEKGIPIIGEAIEEMTKKAIDYFKTEIEKIK